jgi:hypothetical protein
MKRGRAGSLGLERVEAGAAVSDAIAAAGRRRVVVLFVYERYDLRVRGVEAPFEGDGDVRLERNAEAFAFS